MVVFVCLYITLSEGIEFLKSLLGIAYLLIIFHKIYGAVCIPFTHLRYDDFENKCTLSSYQTYDPFAIV